VHVFIVGGGNAGYSVAQAMAEKKHQVTLVEKKAEVCSLISQATRVTTVCGDGCEVATLREAGMAKADVVVAVTGHDEDNLVVSLLAKFEFGTPRVISRVNNPKNAWLFTPKMGVDVAISSSEIITALILEETTMGELITLLKLRHGQAALVEETLSAASKAVDKRIGELVLPPESVIVAVFRDSQLVIPHADTVLKTGDEILALTTIENEARLSQVFS